ncbi:transcriptional regulator [Comamonas squillarum]|jgi:DNA-binding transcriptional regulator YdaS (Cro superfamily)|uniref:Helix-turn-helix domain-containing protein n=1 Tax=Comamonas squillarum TaxID=2977320 RepID=A0ABY6A1M9_9BURK|nr:helix-turn-helix domain-containing protein [Comamonas sp. PR12]UXC20036.1 helix-turn-helix domain-containing protein [Comamonas sp. PR12]
MSQTVADASVAKATCETVANAIDFVFMKLSEYFLKPNALSVGELRARISAKSDAQVRQWRDGYQNRRPSPAYAVAIEQATGGQVTRKDLYPSEWGAIWPELIKSKKEAA